MPDELWAIVGSFSEREAAEALGNFLTSKGIPVQISEPSAWRPGAFAILIPQGSADNFDSIVDWVAVTSFADATSAAVMAGRLTSEGIPATAEAPSRYKTGPFSVFVPRQLKSRAGRIAKRPPISDDELTALALGSSPEKSK